MIWESSSERENLPKKYGCSLLFSKASDTQIKDKSLPTDCKLVKYRDDDEICVDIIRGNFSSVFDLYYDKIGSKPLISIEFGYGTANPRNWGYMQENKSKK